MSIVTIFYLKLLKIQMSVNARNGLNEGEHPLFWDKLPEKYEENPTV